jgi:alkyldihydroxyacetonephosphate synthase
VCVFQAFFSDNQDIGIEYGILADSFETSVPWDKVSSLCKNVKIRVEKECAARNVKYFMITW